MSSGAGRAGGGGDRRRRRRPRRAGAATSGDEAGDSVADIPKVTFQGTDEEVLDELERLVASLDHSDPRRAGIAGSDVPGLLVELLAANRSLRINRDVCRTLLQISVLESGRKAIVKAGGLRVLLPLIEPTATRGDGSDDEGMADGSEQLGLGSYAVAVVANLALEASDIIIKSGGLQSIISVANSRNLTDKQNACRALFSMAIDFSEELVSGGAIGPLKEALEVDSPRVQKNAAGALANMSRNTAVLGTLMQHDIMPSLLRLIRSNDERVVRQVIRNLHSCAVNPLASQLIVDGGVLPVIVMLVKSDNAEFQKHGAGALCCISHKHAKAVADAGGIPPLIRACRRHKQALRAVQALSASAEVKAGVVEAGGLRALAEACNSKELRLAQVAASAMANLAIGSTKGMVLKDKYAWAAICKAAKSGVTELQEQACRAFFGLSCNKQCAEVYIRDNVLGMLLDALSSRRSALAAKQHAAGAIANLCNFKRSRDKLLKMGVLIVAVRALWTGADRLRLHASRALRLLGVADVVLPYHDSEGEQLKSDLLAMVGHVEFSDCSFLVGEYNEEVYAHRAIVAMRCPAFREVLNCPPFDRTASGGADACMKEDSDSDGGEDGPYRVPLPGVESVEHFNLLLQYLYTGSCGTRDARVVVDLATKFQLPGMAALVGHRLELTSSAASFDVFGAATTRGLGSGAGAGAGAGGRAATGMDADGDGDGDGDCDVAMNKARPETGKAAASTPGDGAGDGSGGGQTADESKRAAVHAATHVKHSKRAHETAGTGVSEPGAAVAGGGGKPGGSAAALKVFEPLLQSGWLADVRIRANDGAVVQAHKVILCARCEYLHAMFDAESNWRESRQDEVPVDLPGDVFRVLCRYMYTGRAEMSVEQAPQVLCAAAHYLLPGLQLQCELRLADSVTKSWSTLHTALAATVEVSAPTLRAFCIHTMLEEMRQAKQADRPVDAEVVKVTHEMGLEDELSHWAEQWGFASTR